MTDRNYIYFKSNIDKLIEQYNGRFVVIKDATVIADYENFDEAYASTLKTEELGTFLIQQCVDPENSIAHFAWYNVSFNQAVQI